MPKDPAPLTGLAIGDSLGMPFETASRFESRLLTWDGSYHSSVYHKLGPGQWTDDTMMSLCLAESLVENRALDPSAVARKYLAWFQSGDHRGMGRSTNQALANLARGARWSESGVQKAEGNGTAMRAGILGVFFRDPVSAGDCARLEAMITHASTEAEEGSAAIACATALLLSGCTKDRLLAEVVPLLRTSAVRRGTQQIQALMAQGTGTLDHLGIEIPTGAHVVQTVPAAFLAFLLTNTYVECVEAAVRAGGDTDTTAAIAGGLAGAYYGFDAIPGRLRAPLEAADRLRRVELALLQTSV